MDAFYASVEQRDFPEYRGKPLIVGGKPEGRGGVVAAASYEARKYGIRSAMPSRKAKELCPHAIFVSPRFAVYKEISKKIREIFHRYTDLVEPLSLDEAYLDVTEDKAGIGSAVEIAKLIRQAIRDELHLTASAGISSSKFVAKVASDINKPDGLTFIGPSKITAFMEKLPVEKFYGVGKVTADKMKSMGLFTGADLKRLTEEELVKNFGKSGRYFYNLVRGIDNRIVQPHRESKSLGAEDTFSYDLTTSDEMIAEAAKIAKIVADRMQKYQLRGRTITLKIKYHDFRQITRNKSLNYFTCEEQTIFESAKELILKAYSENIRVRLLGITVSNFESASQRDKNGQLELFD